MFLVKFFLALCHFGRRIVTIYLCQGLVFPCCSRLSFTIRLFFTWHTSTNFTNISLLFYAFCKFICWHSPRQQLSAILICRHAKACGTFRTQFLRQTWRSANNAQIPGNCLAKWAVFSLRYADFLFVFSDANDAYHNLLPNFFKRLQFFLFIRWQQGRIFFVSA